MKVCTQCSLNLPLDRYYRRGDRVRSACKSCMSEKSDRDAKKRYDQARYHKNQEQIKESVKVRSSSDYARARKKEYDLTRRPLEREKRRVRYATDPAYKIMCNLRSRLRGAIKRNTKAASTIGLTGCSLDELKQHIESQFGDGMTWEKLLSGEIELDHIRPCASFDLSDPEHQRECFHYSNLQPLWRKDNRRKYSKWITPPVLPSS